MNSRRRTTAAALALAALGIAGVGAAQDGDAIWDDVLGCLEQLRGDPESARACFAPEALDGENSDLPRRAHEALQLGEAIEYEPLSVKYALVSETGRKDARVIHVRGDGRALLVIAVTREADSGSALVGLQWEEVPMDLADRYPFTLAGMPALYYLVLAYACALPLFMIWAAVVCVRRQPRLPWLWVAFILVGVGHWSLVWRPGPLDPELMAFGWNAFKVFGIGFYKNPVFDPWVVSVSFPLGAVVFLWWTRGWKAGPEGSREPDREGNEEA